MASTYTFMDRKWKLRYVRSLPGGDYGRCDPPYRIGKEINILDSLTGEKRLEILLHELLHAAGWYIAEEFVEQYAKDAARIAFAEGFVDGLEHTEEHDE